MTVLKSPGVYAEKIVSDKLMKIFDRGIPAYWLLALWLASLCQRNIV